MLTSQHLPPHTSDCMFRDSKSKPVTLRALRSRKRFSSTATLADLEQKRQLDAACACGLRNSVRKDDWLQQRARSPSHRTWKNVGRGLGRGARNPGGGDASARTERAGMTLLMGACLSGQVACILV